MRITAAAGCTLVAVLVFFAGYELGLQRAGGPHSAAARITAFAAIPPREVLPTETVAPRAAAMVSPEASERSRQEARLRSLTAIAQLARSRSIASTTPLIDAGGIVSQQFLQLFQLTVTEADALQQVIDGTLREVADHARKSAVVTESTPAILTLAIPPLEDSSDLKRKFETGVKSVLGAELYDAFVQIQGPTLDRALGAFASGPRTLSVQRRPSPTTPFLFLDQQASSAGTSTRYAILAPELASLPDGYAWLNQFASQVSTLVPQTAIAKPKVDGTLVVNRGAKR